MKVIHNNLKTQKTIPKIQEYDCVECGSTIEVDVDDLHEGWLGAMWFTCPVCGKENMSDVETELPTKDSVEFPKHFRKSSVDNDAIDISDEEIQKVIRELANKLWDKTNERDYLLTGYGNMIVFIENLASDGEYEIYVCKNYWEGSIKANPADECYGGH